MKLIRFYAGAEKGTEREPVRSDQWDEAEEYLGKRYHGFTRINAVGDYRIPEESIHFKEPSRVYEIIDTTQHTTEVDVARVQTEAGDLAKILGQLSVGWVVLPVTGAGFAISREPVKRALFAGEIER